MVVKVNTKNFHYIKLCLGYPNEDDTDKIIWRKWRGVTKGKFETDLFGMKEVFAIDVSKLIYSNQFWTPAGTRLRKKVLTLNLKRKYWEEIRDFKKLNEYREIKPYWEKRLLALDPEKKEG